MLIDFYEVTSVVVCVIIIAIADDIELEVFIAQE